MKWLLFAFCFIVLIILCFAPFFVNELLRYGAKALETKIDGLELQFIEINETKLYYFHTIYFQNEHVGFVAGSDGSIYKTFDGGYSWTRLNSTTTVTLTNIYFLNDKEGFVVGGESGCSGVDCVPIGPVMIHRLDGGLTWKQIKLNVSERVQLKSIIFINDLSGYTVGYGTILSTRNRGITWQETNINHIQSIMIDIKFVNERKGLIIFHNGIVLKTIDGGIHWNISNCLNNENGNIFSIVNEKLIFQVDRHKIKKSFDFGNTWLNLPTYPIDLHPILRLIFTTENIGYAFGAGLHSGGCFGRSYGAIYFTMDGGLTWRGNNRMKEMSIIHAVSFPTADIGFAMDASTILKIKKTSLF